MIQKNRKKITKHGFMSIYLIYFPDLITVIKETDNL